ncbi:prepilin-type N-terminal cleavage/methylation domain-containing protein [bacterium]|nr:prepilin-type N-terminal cleavage/methylation domain-containing protein [bacterium]
MRRLVSSLERNSGFTFIEIMIVMLVIGYC